MTLKILALPICLLQKHQTLALKVLLMLTHITGSQKKMKGKLTFHKEKCSERNDAKDNSSINTETITFVEKKKQVG